MLREEKLKPQELESQLRKFEPLVPFPQRFKKTMSYKNLKSFIKALKKHNVSLPFIDAIS